MSAAGAGTVDAGRQSGVQFEPAQRNLFATSDAVAEVSGFDTFQAGLDSQQFRLAAALCFQGHFLALNRIHPREPANPGLIEFDRLPALSAARNKILQFVAALEQSLAKAGGVELNRFLHSP